MTEKHEHRLQKCGYGYQCRLCGREWRRKGTITACTGRIGYKDWSRIPNDLKTKTQLREIRLSPRKDALPTAWMVNSSRNKKYGLYPVEKAVSMKPKRPLSPALELRRRIKEKGPLCSRCKQEHTLFSPSEYCRACRAALSTPCPECGGLFFGNGLCQHCEEKEDRREAMEGARYVPSPWKRETVFLDTETTGLSYWDRIVEIAIVNEQGKVLLDTLVNPERPIPADATDIHGITDAMVENAPIIQELQERIIDLVKDKRLVIYNSGYDMQYLGFAAKYPKLIECCMERFAEFYGEWNDYFGDYKWQSLGTAAMVSGYEWKGEAHRALADTLVCRHVWEWLDEQNEKSDGKPGSTERQ